MLPTTVHHDPTRIIVRGLRPTTVNAVLSKYFGRYGQIVEVDVGRYDRVTGSRSLASVTFRSPESVRRVLRDHGHIIQGAQIECQVAPREWDFKDQRQGKLRMDDFGNSSPSLPTKVFVDGLPMGMTEGELMAEFGRFGRVKEATIVRSKGCGFVVFDSALACRRSLGPQIIRDRSCEVRLTGDRGAVYPDFPHSINHNPINGAFPANHCLMDPDVNSPNMISYGADCPSELVYYAGMDGPPSSFDREFWEEASNRDGQRYSAEGAHPLMFSDYQAPPPSGDFSYPFSPSPLPANTPFPLMHTPPPTRDPNMVTVLTPALPTKRKTLATLNENGRGKSLGAVPPTPWASRMPPPAVLPFLPKKSQTQQFPSSATSRPTLRPSLRPSLSAAGKHRPRTAANLSIINRLPKVVVAPSLCTSLPSRRDMKNRPSNGPHVLEDSSRVPSGPNRLAGFPGPIHVSTNLSSSGIHSRRSSANFKHLPVDRSPASTLRARGAAGVGGMISNNRFTDLFSPSAANSRKLTGPLRIKRLDLPSQGPPPNQRVEAGGDRVFSRPPPLLTVRGEGHPSFYGDSAHMTSSMPVGPLFGQRPAVLAESPSASYSFLQEHEDHHVHPPYKVRRRSDFDFAEVPFPGDDHFAMDNHNPFGMGNHLMRRVPVQGGSNRREGRRNRPSFPMREGSSHGYLSPRTHPHPSQHHSGPPLLPTPHHFDLPEPFLGPGGMHSPDLAPPPFHQGDHQRLPPVIIGSGERSENLGRRIPRQADRVNGLRPYHHSIHF